MATFRDSTLTLECHAGTWTSTIQLDGSALPVDTQVVVPGKPVAIPAA